MFEDIKLFYKLLHFRNVFVYCCYVLLVGVLLFFADSASPIVFPPMGQEQSAHYCLLAVATSLRYSIEDRDREWVYESPRTESLALAGNPMLKLYIVN